MQCEEPPQISTLSCIAPTGTSLTSPAFTSCGPFPSPPPSGNRSCIASSTSSGVTCLVSSGLVGGARKSFETGDFSFGLFSFERAESRFFSVNSSEWRRWPKPWELATASMDLKYCCI